MPRGVTIGPRVSISTLMLHINDLTYRIDGKLLLDGATAAVPTGHKVGLVGRNGVGKTTLLRLLLGELEPESGTIRVPRHARIGTVAQEAPSGEQSLIETVLAADAERAALLGEAEQVADPHRIAEVQTRLADIDAHAAPARAATILAGLGFTPEQQEAPCSALSGGWRMRVALAAALFAEPAVLLLDEPTNYLDLEGVIWLQTYLKTYGSTVVIVSHDRDLLNQAVGSILHLDRGKLTLYRGGYDDFERLRREQQSLQAKLRSKQEDARKHMQAFVDRFRAQATKARQAQSRLKALEKMEPIPDLVEDRVAPFYFPNPARPLNPPLVRFENVAVGYGGEPVLKDLNLRIDTEDRIALLGANGNGKSTFAKLLTGRLQPMAGHMHRHNRLVVGYFAQHQLDEVDAERSPYEHVCDLMPDSTVAVRRARLGAYGFGAGMADTKAGNLSGGEKARLLFALATFRGPHILVLDEPTNHLDVDARQALIQALNDFAGAVILISHDRHLIETTADRLWIADGGMVKPYDDDLDSYSQQVLDSARNRRRTGAPLQGNGLSPSQAKTKRVSRAAAPLHKTVEQTEAMIGTLQQKIAVLDQALADPTLYRDEPGKVAQFARLRNRLAAELESAEEAWLKAQTRLEKLAQEA
jgi:ATP-binding cassette, subfamily F, member 3